MTAEWGNWSKWNLSNVSEIKEHILEDLQRYKTTGALHMNRDLPRRDWETRDCFDLLKLCPGCGNKTNYKEQGCLLGLLDRCNHRVQLADLDDSGRLSLQVICKTEDCGY